MDQLVTRDGGAGMIGGPIPVPDDVVRAGLQVVYERGYLRGLRRAIVLRLVSRFGDTGVYFGPWLAEFSDAASLEAFFDAIETAPSLEALLLLFPKQP